MLHRFTFILFYFRGYRRKFITAIGPLGSLYFTATCSEC